MTESAKAVQTTRTTKAIRSRSNSTVSVHSYSSSTSLLPVYWLEIYDPLVGDFGPISVLEKNGNIRANDAADEISEKPGLKDFGTRRP